MAMKDMFDSLVARRIVIGRRVAAPDLLRALAKGKHVQANLFI